METIIPIVRRGGLARGALRAAVAASVTTEAMGVLARLAGVPVKAQSSFDRVPKPIRPGDFTITVVPAIMIGAVVAAALGRTVRHPAQIFIGLATLFTAVSLLAPLGAPHTALATKIILAIAHVATAVIAIPLLAREIGYPARP